MAAPNTPQPFDGVLGGTPAIATGGLVLGGLAGIRQRLQTGTVAQQVQALWASRRLGAAAIPLWRDLLYTSADVAVQRTAYRLLRASERPQAKAALQDFFPGALFECVAAVTRHGAAVSSIAIGGRSGRYGPATPLAVSASRDGTVLVWDLTAQAVMYEWQVARRIAALAIDAATDCVVWEDAQQQRDARYLLNGQPIEPPAIALPRRDPTVLTVAARYLVSGSHTTVQIWDLAQQRPLGTLPGHTATITAIAVSSDHHWLATGTRNGTLRFWSLPST